MQIRNEFTLELPPQETYELLLDLERVTPCMPGASLGERREDGSYAVNVKVKLGPMRFSYDGAVRIAEQDAAARRAVLQGSANEAKGQGSADAAITMQVEEAPEGSRVTATADVDLTGRAAQMGHGVVESVTRQLIGQMTRCLSQRFVEGAGEPAAAAAPAAPTPPANG
ncbi:MAG TPA: SRPBCC family protein, partial [Conexibacter sp.]|nr:SRPBCC family protein [Conexibacter sp.]